MGGTGVLVDVTVLTAVWVRVGLLVELAVVVVVSVKVGV